MNSMNTIGTSYGVVAAYSSVANKRQEECLAGEARGKNGEMYHT